MCKASIYARAQRPAVAGEVLALGRSAYGLGAFHEVGKTIDDCVVCVQNGASLTLAGISAAARAIYPQLGEVEEVTFVETAGSHHYVIHDLFLFPGHPELGALPAAYFAGSGVRATMHRVEGGDDVVEEIKRMALKPMLVANTPTIEEVLARRSRLLAHVG